VVQFTKPSSVRRKTIRITENITFVSANVKSNSKLSVSSSSQKLSIIETDLRRIMLKDLNVHGYKIQWTQKLQIGDHYSCTLFADWIIENLMNSAEFLFENLYRWSPFDIEMLCQISNCRIWNDENRREIKQQSFHAKSDIMVFIVVKRYDWILFSYGNVINLNSALYKK